MHALQINAPLFFTVKHGNVHLILCIFFQPLDVFNGTTGNGLTVATSHQMPQAANAKVSGPNVKKQDVPCYFFQIDSCMKGDMCPFLHGSQNAFPSVNPPQPSKLTAADEPETRINGPLQKCQNKQNVPQPHTQNPADQLVAAERSVKVEVAPCQRTSQKESALSANNIVDEFADPEASDSPLSNENGGDRQFSYPEDDFQNCEDADEFLGESSPGFDVLVDNDDENSDYFHNEDEMGVDSGHSGRLTSSLNVFDLNGLSDPDRLAIYDRDFGNYANYDQYMHGYYRNDLSNYALSEGITDGLKGDRRGILSLESHETISGSDLRHRLSRKRRAYGHRAARRSDRLSNYLSRGKFPAGEHRYGIHPYRDQKKFSSNRSISSRFRGRLKLPEISDPENGDYLHHNGENEGQRQLGRFSFNQVAFANQRRHRHERTRQDLASDCRRTSSFHRDGDLPTRDFARNTNGVYTKHENVGGQQRLENSVSFEGPKPLSILLKIKREAASANNKDSLSSEDDSQRQKVDSVSGEKDFTKKAKMEAFSIEREETICEGQLSDQKEDAYSLKEGVLSDAMAGDQEYEPYDGDEEYEYDPAEEGGGIGDYHNASPGDVYIDDDDDGYDGE